ncbi:MAG: sodium:alanine symporter family protein [Treponema sp.]|jgi:AGCS family alanine or glycine:cation symporter|nr:sodium:alanine symporter family protein [Treponema sp.]
METFTAFVGAANAYVWGPWLLVLLFGTHLFITFRTGIQRKLLLGIKLSVTADRNGEGEVSQFGALTTALASTIGTGNIIGVGTAVALGGPGAILWMWLTGIFGIATKYAETWISVKYRVKDENGAMLGGAMFALERGLKLKWLAVLFAVLAALAAFGIGAGVQANAVANLMNETFDIPMISSGIVIALLTALVIIGGLKSIEKVCIALVPFMSVLYIAGCVTILVIHHEFVLPAIAEICRSAFTARAAGGGFIAAALMQAMRYGIARGLFSNESGMGSAPLVAAAAQTRNAVRQSLVSSTGTFWDTVVICLLTGLVIVSSVIGNPEISAHAVNGSLLVHAAFSQIPFIGKIVLTFGLLTFAFSTILGWSYYGERCTVYLLGVKAGIPYRIIYIAMAFIGCAFSVNVVWDIADTLNALMTIPNLAAVLLLSGAMSRETKKFLEGNHIEDTDDEPVPYRHQLGRKVKEV